MDRVFSNCTSPRKERYSHCTGTITPFDATSALMVSKPERRRRVDEDVVVLRLDAHERLLECALAADHRRERKLGAGEVDRRHGDVDLGRPDDLLDRKLVDEHVEHRPLDLVRVPALAHGQVALGIQVDEQDLVALFLEGDSEVQRGRGFRHAALLVGE